MINFVQHEQLNFFWFHAVAFAQNSAKHNELMRPSCSHEKDCFTDRSKSE